MKKYAYALGALIALGFLLVLVSRFRSGPTASGGVIERRWNDAIKQHRIMPVYPPRQDVEIGDVYVARDRTDLVGGDGSLAASSPRWFRIPTNRMKISSGSAEIPEISLTSDSMSDVQAAIPWEMLRARLGGRGSSLTTATVSMRNVQTRSVDGYELISTLKTWENSANYIRPEFRDRLTAFIDPAPGNDSKITMRVVTEIFRSDVIDADIRFQGELRGDAGLKTDTPSPIGDAEVTVSSATTEGFSVNVHRKLKEPIVVGVRGYTLVVSKDWSVFVDPDVSRGAGSGGLIPAE